jgi:hypothetical protein
MVISRLHTPAAVPKRREAKVHARQESILNKYISISCNSFMNIQAYPW